MGSNLLLRRSHQRAADGIQNLAARLMTLGRPFVSNAPILCDEQSLAAIPMYLSLTGLKAN
jgi:hypothetical protein